MNDAEEELKPAELPPAKSASWIYRIPQDYYVVALLAIVAYFIGYLSYVATPGNLEDYFMGWFGWHDQGMYLKSAEAIAQGNLSAATYVYPLGYPLLAVPFLKWLPRHPFLIPNLFFAVGIVLAFYASCRRLVTKIESAGLSLFLIVLSAFTYTAALPGGLIWSNALIVPWNLIPVFFGAYLTIWLLIFNVADFRKLAIVSLAIAFAFFCRPPDILFLGILYLAGLKDLKSLKAKLQGAAILAVPCSLVLATILFTKWRIFHSLLSPYDITHAGIGFSLHDLPFKFYLVFIDGSPIYGYKELMLLRQMPWLLLIIPGIVLLARFTNAKSWFLMGAIAMCLIFYISFNAQAPSNTFNYHGYRYFMWIFPYLGLCAYLTLTRAWARLGKQRTLAGVSAGILFILVVGWREDVVATVSAAEKGSVGSVLQFFEPDARRFSSEVSLSESTYADGIQLVFSTVPSRNMLVSSEWQSFNLTIDGKKQSLYHDYNLYQSDNVVYVSFRNLINQTGQFQTALVQYQMTDPPVLDRVNVLKKEFEFFSLVKAAKDVGPPAVVPVESQLSNDQSYEWGQVVSMGAGGNAGPYKVTGWSGNDTGFTWTEGHRAVLRFKTPPAETGIVMNLEAAGLASPTPQTVEIEVNDKPLKKLVMSNGREMYNIDIPSQYLKPDGILQIQFDMPNAISPFELRMNQDKRVLSMGVFTLTLSPAGVSQKR
jgi:hypothetical protein